MLAWLGEIGVDFPPERLVSPNGRMVARAHEPVGFGASIVERLDFELSRRGVDVACNTRVEELALAPDGSVCGVRIGGESVAARAVVLACGGIGGAPDLVSRMLPKSRRTGDWRWHVGCETNRGDGLRMAEALGARLCGEDSGLLLASPNFHHDLEVIGPDWVIMLNFARRAHRARGRCLLGTLGSARGAGRRARLLHLRSRADAGRGARCAGARGARAGHDLAQLDSARAAGAARARARDRGPDDRRACRDKAGLDRAAVTRAVERYNALAHAGHDADFGKAARCLKPLAAPPYYAVEVRPSIVIVTGAGPAIDGRTRV